MFIWKILLLTTALAQPPSGSDEVKPEFLITGTRAGHLELRMPVDTLWHFYSLDSVKPGHDWDEGLYNPELYVFEGEKKLLEIHVDCARIGLVGAHFIINSMLVLDERFRTTKGIGVGSTLGELKKKYPVTDIYERVHGPYHTLRVLVKGSRIVFFLNITADNLDLPMDYYSIDDIIPFVPDSSRIEAVWIPR